MTFHPPVHPEYVMALRVLDAFGMPYAEAWRLLRPVAARLGIPRPSYASVRRILIAERERKRRRADELDRLLADLFTGRFPYATVEHKLIGLGPPEGGPLPPSRRAGMRPVSSSSARRKGPRARLPAQPRS